MQLMAFRLKVRAIRLGPRPYILAQNLAHLHRALLSSASISNAYLAPTAG